jgi:hypothetical protein
VPLADVLMPAARCGHSRCERITNMETSEPTASGSPNRAPHARGLRRFIVPVKLPPPVHPALIKHAEERGKDVQNRIADRITAFAGSMTFVYLHIIWFSCWIGFGVEKYPFGLLTMIVSLEAIFLSTFVMISQNRADAKRQVIADEEWRTVEAEDQQNQELLELSREILALIKDARSRGSELDR